MHLNKQLKGALEAREDVQARWGGAAGVNFEPIP